MDSSLALTSPPVYQNDEWDTDGFVIPSLGIDNPDHNATPSLSIDAAKPSSPKTPNKEEGVYVEPLDTHYSQQKQMEPIPIGREQKLKHKLKEADKRSIGSGTVRENNLEHLRELVGVGTKNSTSNMPKCSPRDWLDPHCHESEFERRPSQ